MTMTAGIVLLCLAAVAALIAALENRRGEK